MKLELINIPDLGWHARDGYRGMLYEVTDWKLAGTVLLFTVVGQKQFFVIDDAYDDDDPPHGIDDFDRMEAHAVTTGIKLGDHSFNLQEKYFIREV